MTAQVPKITLTSTGSNVDHIYIYIYIYIYIDQYTTYFTAAHLHMIPMQARYIFAKGTLAEKYLWQKNCFLFSFVDDGVKEKVEQPVNQGGK